MNVGLTNTDIAVLTVDSNGIFYAGTHGGGVFKSSDSAGRWAAVNSGLSNGYITSLAASTAGGLYAGTDKGIIFKSADGGATWVAAAKSLGFSVNALAVDANGMLYAGVYNDTEPVILRLGLAFDYSYWPGDGLFKSADGGNTWQAYGNTSTVSALTIDANGTLYISGYDKFHSRFCAPDPDADFSSFLREKGQCSTLFFGRGGVVYAGMDYGRIFKRSVLSKDWVHIRSSLGLQHGLDFNLAVDGAGTLYVVDVDGVSILKSTNFGRDWIAVESRVPGRSVNSLTVDADGVLYAGTSDGVFKSSNGGNTWETLAGLENFFITKLFVDGHGTVYALTFGVYDGPLKFFKKPRDSEAWIDVSNGLESSSAFDVYVITMDAAGTLYIGTAYKGIFKSSDAGRSWVRVNNSLLKSPESFEAGTFALAVDTHGVLYAATHQGVFKTPDGGTSWMPVNDGLNGAFVNALAADAYGAVYARTNTSAYKLVDGGAWAAVNSGLPTGNTDGYQQNIGTLVLDQSGRLYTKTYGSIFQYTPPTMAGLKPRLVNLSGRANTLTAEGVAIAGFTISGGNKTVLLTAKGPSLFTAGVPNPLANPKLRVMDSKGGLVASNDNWGDNLNIAAITATQGAPTDASESALLLTLPPGAYTAIMEGANAGTGNGLVAVDGVANPGDSGSLTNLSTRAMVGTGDNVLIAGLTIVDGPRKILLTAKGPSMTALGVTGALADPTIALHDATGALIAANDDQASAANYAEIVATGKAPSDPRESAILLTLQPGIYTLIVRGSGGTQGIALVAVDQVD